MIARHARIQNKALCYGDSYNTRIASTQLSENFSMVYIPFFVDRLTGQTGRRIFTHDGSNDAVLRKGQTFSGTEI